MDETVFVILLLTGFCITSAHFPHIYYFIEERMTWFEARDYCLSKNSAIAQIYNNEYLTEMMNTPTGGYTDKAWIGLFENTSEWTWVDGQLATYFHWNTDQTNSTNATGFCVIMTDGGFWSHVSCSNERPSVCFNGDRYDIVETEMTWDDAESNCQVQSSNLAIIPDNKTNSEISQLLEKITEVWIGLSKTRSWYWLTTGTTKEYTLMNWQSGRPNDLDGWESCGAVVVKDGTWTDEQCDVAYPFFCIEVHKLRITVVKMKIKSSGSWRMEDPTFSAELQKQLHAAFANQHMTDFKLTWKKPPVKQTYTH